MLPSYVPVLILAVVAIGFAAFTLGLSQLLGRPRPNPAKNSIYECGVPPIGTARERFPIKFYLICMIFILLDVDAAFLYPWALTSASSGSSRWPSSCSFWAVASPTPGRSAPSTGRKPQSPCSSRLRTRRSSTRSSRAIP